MLAGFGVVWEKNMQVYWRNGGYCQYLVTYVIVLCLGIRHQLYWNAEELRADHFTAYHETLTLPNTTLAELKENATVVDTVRKWIVRELAYGLVHNNADSQQEAMTLLHGVLQHPHVANSELVSVQRGGPEPELFRHAVSGLVSNITAKVLRQE
ncbi:unnamed protein product, partial [Amoebophrya sp. A120]|eukprot:GSA120T00003876001.1